MSEAVPFWLVWRTDGPAPTFRHSSREKAEAEAARLAKENGREKFFVLQPISAFAACEVAKTHFDPDIPF